MKRRMIIAMLTIMTTVTVNGCNVDNRQATAQENVKEQSVVTDTLTDITINDLISKTEICYTNTQEEYEKFYDKLEQRDGKIMIEVVQGTVINDDGCGELSDGSFIKYHGDFAVGDRVQTVFVFNPDNNSTDDIIYRTDSIIE